MRPISRQRSGSSSTSRRTFGTSIRCGRTCMRCVSLPIGVRRRGRHEMPCNHNLEAYLHAYIQAAGIAGDHKGYLFRSVRGKSGELTTNPLAQSNVYRMICRRDDEVAVDEVERILI